MANRPVFTAIDSYPYVRAIDTEFEFFPGFSLQQKQRSIDSLHEAFCRENLGKSILEISSKSQDALGIELSAFNLQIEIREGNFSVEMAFQSSKVFEYGGAYKDLLRKTSLEAKSVAIFVGLNNAGKLEESLKSKDRFLQIVYHE